MFIRSTTINITSFYSTFNSLFKNEVKMQFNITYYKLTVDEKTQMKEKFYILTFVYIKSKITH